MKKITILVLILLMVLLTNQVIAQKLIALQSGDKATFYTDLDTALYYAKNGDDIYLPGGYIKANSTSLKIDKTVNIIGVGYNPYTNPATENTIIQSAKIEIGSNVIGGSISGVYAKNCNLWIKDAVSYFSVSRSLFTNITIGSYSNTIPANNISIIETIVELIYCNITLKSISVQNVSISNCIIGNTNQISSLSGNNNWEDLKCKNSIIFANISDSGLSFMSGVQKSLFENCIFLSICNTRSPIKAYNNTFHNCLSRDLFNSTTFDCITNQDPSKIFIDPQGFVYNMKNDFRLQDSSPGKNAGKDGTDIGIYGGRYPWKEGGLPVNPHVETFNVAGKTDSIGNLKVKIKVAAQEN